MSDVLVLSPHPDDEAIGLGGAIRRHVEAGDDVHVTFLTSGERGGHGRTPDEERRRREREASDAAAILGLASYEFWREPDGALRASRLNVSRVRATMRRLRPAAVYAPHPAEAHADHRAAWRMVTGALAADGTDPRLLLYEVWTPLQRMHHVVDVSAVMETKLAAIRAYAGQCAVLRFDEAFRGLARYRGEMFLWPGGDYAEVFEVHRR